MATRILIVDDDAGMRETLADIFTDQGYRVDRAEDGAKAVETFRPEAYALVLMDIRMPNMDGVEALRLIREQSPAQPVILMTAYSMDGLLSQAEDLGAQAILPKPLDWERLLALLRQLTRDG